MSDYTHDGTLDPALIEQVGYMSSGNQTVFTDRTPNVGYDFQIDEAHDWIGSSAEVDIWSLTKTFVSNGTFDEGLPGINENYTADVDAYPFGWNAWANTSDSGTIQRTGYVAEDRKYILMENEGDPIGTGVNLRFQHGAGTIIQFNQSIRNAPYTEDFVFSFDYNYVRGPLGLSVGENISLVARADGIVVWSTNLADLPQRNQWYSTGEIGFNHVGLSDPFIFQVAMEIPYDLQIYYVDHGFINAAYFTIHVDDIVLNAATTPDFEEVDLQFAAGSGSSPVVGSAGIGSTSISNASYWRSAPLSTRINANTTVSYNYRIRLKTHRFTNSTWTTDIGLEGTSYSVSPGESPTLSFHAYLGFLGGYEELTQMFHFPSDWENATILDPFKTDVTSSCSLTDGQIVIPTIIMDRLGWWEVRLQSPNYAKTLTTEVYDSSGDQWSAESIFRSGNRSKLAASIGSSIEAPEPLNLVNMTWLMPNGTIWYQESVSGGINGDIDSSELEFGPVNTTAGEWQVHVIWTNGTEVAAGETVFEIIHRANLTPIASLIETESGMSFWAQVEYKDDENQQVIIDDVPGSYMNGNWSASVVPFEPNPSQKWWEAQFDTSMLAAGDWTVVVSAHRDYFDDVSCQFTVRLLSVDNTLTIDVTNAEVDLGATHIATFTYTDWLGAGIDSADVDVTIDGPDGGISWTPPANDLGGGDYSIEFSTHISGNYRVFITASRTFYEESTDTLFLLVGELGSNFTILNPSPDVVQYGDNYNLQVRYTNSSGDGLEGATVGIISVTPAAGLTMAPAVDEGNGIYTFHIIPTITGTYQISFRANITNYKAALGSFILSVNKASGSLSLNYSSPTISLDQSCIVTLNFTSDLNGSIGGGYVAPSFKPPGLIFSDTEDLGGGWYRIVITATEAGTYPLTFVASYPNHLNYTKDFPLTVIVVPTKLRTSNGLYSANIEFMTHFTISLLFERTDEPANVSGSSIQVTFISGTALDWDFVQNGDFYEITFHADSIQVRRLLITASKDDHHSDSIEFLLNVVEITTEVTGASLPYTLTLDNPFSFIYHYNISANSTGIEGAEIDATRIGSEWVNWADLGYGQYRITVTPQDTGNYTVALTFSKNGFQPRTTSISFKVYPTDVSVQLLSSTQWYWQKTLPVSVNVTNSETGDPISNATVRYILFRFGSAIETGNLTESSAGSYSGVTTSDWDLRGGLRLRIVVEKAFHRQSEPFEVAITEALGSDQVLAYTITEYGPPIFGLMAVVVCLVASQRLVSRRRKAYIARALAVKRRFDDANNLIGIIILHKTSGLPVYSNILKGGFEEGMISAFITAITHFRSEFDRDDYDIQFEVLPISDIIRAVPTRNLVCAFITVSSASRQQEAKMIEFARGVSRLMDDDSAERPTEVNNTAVTQILERYFDEVMDGFLLRYYKRGKAGAFPKRYRCLDEALNFTEEADCSRPTYMALVMTERCKITEAEASLLVLESIESKLIVPCSKHDMISFAPARPDEGKDLPQGPVRM